MTTWIDGGYEEGERVEINGVECKLLTSLGSLGWVVQEIDAGKKTLALFAETVKG